MDEKSFRGFVSHRQVFKGAEKMFILCLYKFTVEGGELSMERSNVNGAFIPIFFLACLVHVVAEFTF